MARAALVKVAQPVELGVAVAMSNSQVLDGERFGDDALVGGRPKASKPAVYKR